MSRPVPPIFNSGLGADVATPRAERVLTRTFEPSEWVQLGGFGLVLVAFIATIAYSHIRTGQLDEAAAAIAEHAAPSIERLAAARADLHQLREALAQVVSPLAAGRPSGFEAVRAAQRTFEADVRGYLALPAFDGERSAFQELGERLPALNATLEDILQAVQGGRLDEANGALQLRFLPQFEALGTGLIGAIRFNAEQSARLGTRIRAIRARASLVTYATDALALALGGLALTFGAGLARQRRHLLNRRAELQARRVDELEAFSGRVAHDLLSPLTPVSMFLHLVERTHPEDEGLHRNLERARNGLRQAKALVQGLLDFASAGAKPPEGARASLAEVMESLAPELSAQAAEARVDLILEGHDQPVALRCAPGVLISLLSNLVRNAIKYMGESADRRVVVRVAVRDGMVRFEVEDTGPGLPSGFEARIFEPFVRGPNTGRPGIGLGLSTVKRLAESHGGRVGVHSASGGGCRFWFLLPVASSGERADSESAALMH